METLPLGPRCNNTYVSNFPISLIDRPLLSLQDHIFCCRSLRHMTSSMRLIRLHLVSAILDPCIFTESQKKKLIEGERRRNLA